MIGAKDFMLETQIASLVAAAKRAGATWVIHDSRTGLRTIDNLCTVDAYAAQMRFENKIAEYLFSIFHPTLPPNKHLLKTWVEQVEHIRCKLFVVNQLLEETTGIKQRTVGILERLDLATALHGPPKEVQELAEEPVDREELSEELQKADTFFGP